MSHSNAQTQTLHGHYQPRAESPPAETEVIDEGRVVRRFAWAAGLPAEVLADFTREATSVARLRHPHIVPVHSAGRLGDGTAHVVVERLRGRTLEEAMEGGPVPVADLVPIVRGVASALSAAHAAGVAHGGLRADTVFLAEMPGYRWGFPMLLDFGVARLGDAGQPDAHADQLALVALAIRALGRPFSSAAQRVLERATSWDARLPFASVTSFMETLEEALTIASTDVAPVTAPAPVAVAAPAPGNPPSSLTQQFFAEGERQDVAHAAEDDDLEPDAADVSVARVPRNRAQIAAATGIAVAAVAIIVGTLVSLSTAPDATPPAAVVIQRPADAPAPTPRATPQSPAGAARASGESRPAQRERSHQGRAAPHRARHAEPPRFVPAPVTPAVTAPPVATPAPAVVAPIPAAPAPAPEAAAPAAVAGPAAQAAEPAATPATAAAEDTAADNDDDVTQPQPLGEGETE